MTDRKLELTRRKALAGLGAIGAAGAGAGLGTSALYSDSESSTGNSIQAGELDLVVDYVTTVTQDGVSTGSTTSDGTIQGGVSGEYQIADAKPGDSGFLAFCPKIVDNPGWLFVGSAGGVTDYENGQTEPEEDVDPSGGGSLGSSQTGPGAGELSEAIQVDVEYCEPNTTDPQGPDDYDTIREFNNPNDYTLADLFKDLETGFLLDGDPNGASGRQAYPSSPDDATQNGPCLCISWEIPTDVGNEIQSDGVEFDVTFAARQERNNSTPENPFVDLTVGSGSEFDYSSIQAAVGAASPGDVISVADESFTPSSPVTVGTEDLTIAGAGESVTTIDASGLERGMAIEADGVTVCDLTVDAAGSGVSSGEVEGIFVGDASQTGFTDTGGTIRIRDVTVSNVDGGDSTAEGIHIKSYDTGDPINGVSINGVTIDGVAEPNAGGNGIKIQSDVNNVTIYDTTITNISGAWSYGVTPTASSVESGTPEDISIVNSTIDTVTANTYAGVGVGIGSASGDFEPATSGARVADPTELSIIGTDFDTLDIGILDKNTDENSLDIDLDNTYTNVTTIKQGLS